VRRSSKAVTAAIVEGFARRRYIKDYVKFLIYAQAECDETRVHIELILDTNPSLDSAVLNALNEKYELLSRKINKYTMWVEKNYAYRQ